MSYDAIPPDSRKLIESAVRMLDAERKEISTKELAVMLYNLGCIDAGMGVYIFDEREAQS